MEELKLENFPKIVELFLWILDGAVIIYNFQKVDLKLEDRPKVMEFDKWPLNDHYQ